MTTESVPLTAEKAVLHIKSQGGDPKKFRVRAHGFIDWKFGELAEYKGYAEAVQYAESVRRWHDFRKYEQCLLEVSYAAFLEAAKKVDSITL